jgi:outer membrane protein OmpA-like peptidoglycan-associated protein
MKIKVKRSHFLVMGLLLGVSAAAQDVPKVEIPLGFSFINVHPNLPQITSFNAYGGGGQIDFNFGPYFGIKADLMGYTQTALRDKLNNAGYAGAVSGNLFTYMAGPQIKKHTGVFQPFGEVLFGGGHTNSYATLVSPGGQVSQGGGNNNGFVMAAGLGLDLRVNRHISIRPVEADYLLTRFTANHIANYTPNQNNFRYVGGIVLTLGGKPPIPPTAACSITPTEVLAGEPVTATMTTENFNPKHTVTYQWSGTGVSGTGTTGNVATTGLAPGSHTVTAVATDAKEKKNNSATCSASFTVKQPRAPIASCSASPETVKPGDTSMVNVSANSPDGVSLTYSYSATAGRVSGTGNSATLNTADANPGSPINVTATVTDARGLTTTCNATVNVLAPPVVVQQITELGSCNFNESRRPGRVDNECKAVLDDVALKVQREPNNSLVVVGYADETETATATQIAGQRGVNVKLYLTSGEGGASIDPSRIQPRAGTVKKKGATIYLVPSGATFTEESTVVDESTVKGQPRNAPAPKKGKRAAPPTAPN